MPSSSPRWQRRLLAAAFFLGIAVLALSFTALFRAGGYRVGLDLSAGGLRAFSSLLIQTAAMLWLGQPQPAPTDLTFAWARIFAVLFALSAGVGIILELYRPASDLLVRALFWWSRAVRRRRPAVLIGLGSVGGPLARELRRAGRPVYGIALSEEGPDAAGARRAGALVVAGDGTDRAVRARAGLRHASEVFIATGDDGRNVEIAADFLADAQARRSHAGARRTGDAAMDARGHAPGAGEAPSLVCYVHAADPTLSSTLRSHDLLRRRSGGIDLRTFSVRELAAHDLFFGGTTGLLRSADTIPGSDAVFHLFVFGFGATGQTIALHLARFGHFPSGLRPRLTVFADFSSTAGQAALRGFLDRHPAFSPPDLDLASPEFLSTGDGWASRPGRPAAEEYRSPEVASLSKHGRTMRVRPVEYAVNAEFRSLASDVGASGVAAEIAARLRPGAGPPVRGAVAVCLEEEGASFPAALRLQTALAPRLLDGLGDTRREPAAPILPIHVNLPVERGLASLVEDRAEEGLRDEQREIARRLPLRPFGVAAAVGSYEAITQGRLREQALGLRAVYSILSGRTGQAHPDFEDSNLDAAIFSEAIAMSALGIRFLKESSLDPAEAARRRVWPEPLLADLCGQRAARAQKALETSLRRNSRSGKLELEPEAIEAIDRSLRQRLAVLDRIEVPKRPETRAETAEEESRRLRLERMVRGAVEDVIGDLHDDLARRGRDADLPARMEHARWMGERLARGWRFGPRSELRRQRDQLVPWEDLTEAERFYDRPQLPRRILEHAVVGEYAYVALPDSG